MKTRLPISGWNVDAFMVWDDLEEKLVPRDVAWFREQGLDDEELYQAAWGLSCPVTMEDVNGFLSSTATLPEDQATPILSDFVTAMKDLAQKDVSPEYKALSDKLQQIFADNGELNLIQIAEVLKEFGIALARTAGKNFDRMYQNDTGKSYTHGVLHDQNISFFGEWCDSFTLQEGLLEIGLAPENSGDISGLLLALKQYAMNILMIQGEPLNLDTFTRAQSYVEEYFYPELLANWPSYKDYCMALHASEIQQYLSANSGSLKQELEYSGLDDNESNRNKMASQKLGGVPWPLGKPT